MSIRFERWHDKDKAAAKTGGDLLAEVGRRKKDERLRKSGYWAAAGLAARHPEVYWTTSFLAMITHSFLEQKTRTTAQDSSGSAQQSSEQEVSRVAETVADRG